MNLKLVLGAVLLLVALVFSVQNAGVVDVTFLAWKFTISLALVIFAALAAGLIGGWAITSTLRRKGKTSKSPPAP
ncbi:MAG TPA: LapA family protein [Verrucomicrobiae bacterium]|nr:LapA family protein [Verrucomicrobiae bacterium]